MRSSFVFGIEKTSKFDFEHKKRHETANPIRQKDRRYFVSFFSIQFFFMIAQISQFVKPHANFLRHQKKKIAFSAEMCYTKYRIISVVKKEAFMKLLAIDGNSILNRAYYGIRPLSNQKGVYTHAIYGFMNIYLKHVQAIQPDCIAVAFDRREPTFRHKAVETYKANRKGMPEELAMQLPYVKELLTDLGVHVVEQSGYEADDILGTLAKACCKTGQDTCHILTGDRDSLQLVTPCVTVWLVTNKETIPYTPQVFEEEYGFPPISLIDLKALMGDSSDNISGVAGIGKKTATTLIQKWGTVEALYENLDQAGLTKGVYQKLTAGAEAAKQSKWLATIVTDVPIATNPADYQIGAVQVQKAQALLLELELVKLMDKLHLRDAIDPAADPEMEQASPEAPALTTEPATDTLLEQLRQETVVSYLFDGETLELLLEQTIYHTQDPAWIFAFLQDAAIAKQTFSAKPHYRWFFAHRDSLQQRMQLAGDGEIRCRVLKPRQGHDDAQGVFDRVYRLHEVCEKLRSRCDYRERQPCGDRLRQVYRLRQVRRGLHDRLYPPRRSRGAYVKQTKRNLRFSEVPFYWLRKPLAMPVEIPCKKALASGIERSKPGITIRQIRMHSIKTANGRLRATEGSFKSGLGSGQGGGSPQRRPQSPQQRLKPRCRSEAAFRWLCTPARHTPYRPRLPAGRFPAPSTATQAHKTRSYQPSSPLRTACFNSSRSWSSGWARARSKFRISPSRLGAGLGCCFIFSYRSRTVMGIFPWHI